MCDIETDIRAVVNGSGLIATHAAGEVAAAIEQACESTIERMYESVAQNDAMVRDQRKKVDDFAAVLRKYYKAHVGSLSEFLAHLQRTTDELDAHVKGFEDRLNATHYPRATDG